MKLDPNSANRFGSLGNSLLRLNRFQEAAEVYRQALAQKLEDTAIHHGLYWLAFMTRDQAALDRELQWLLGQPDAYAVPSWQAQGAAYGGQWRISMRDERDAIDAAISAGARDTAAGYAAEGARQGAVLGRCAESRSLANQALSLARTPSSLPRAALALALCGVNGETRTLIEELRTRYPRNTLVIREWLPMIQAALETGRGNGAAAIELLKPAVPYEGDMEFWPQYLRADAYLKMRKAPESAAEFRSIWDHRGQMTDSLLYPLARLGMARAAALQGDTNQARKSYQDFLNEWKDADTDLTALVSGQAGNRQIQLTPAELRRRS
jgi:eukaryotic-like serine/threonine-protein kinase